jgi:DNA-binding NtrC family response regulator
VSERARILVVDDKENMRKLFVRLLGGAHEVETAEDGARALELLAARRYDLVVSDIRMPGADGIAVLREAKRRSPETEVVLMTAYATVPAAVEAVKLGAYDYLPKPFDPDDAELVVARALARRRERVLPPQTAARFGGLVGGSAAMRAVYALLEQAAGSDLTVLLLGETGTGKELAARAVHDASARRGRRFVPVNCGALPAELVESELFGHARGAFTGAEAARAGLFEEAAGGTLFLDEIGELPGAMQVKLNRALQEREIRRVGENRAIRVDARVVAATQRDLEAEVREGRFREDLYYRLNVFPVRLPSLRERAEDIPALVAHLIDRQAKKVAGIEPEALRALVAHAWPGNVRQLENAIGRAIAVAKGERIGVADLPLNVAPEVARGGTPVAGEGLVQIPYRDAVERAREQVARDYLIALMKELRGNVTRAAERAGMERESLHRLLKRHGVRSEDFK